MSKMPVCSGRDAVRAFGKIGYAVDHQTGSHIILRNGTLRSLIREAGLTVDQFKELLD